ncbi:uncharacterized protein LOC134262054 [Saccostrea cucullata]|uniref:uncharacterized protein LOC134262054 n=1 Tax=Saccostrea cuccullata TaxID=36930 RepID=UPI002ED458F1
MSLIGLMFYLRSWFSKMKASSSSVSNQVYTDQAENQEDHRYESQRSSSSTATETVQQRTPNHQDLNSYTVLRFSQMQPMYDNSKDDENAQEPEAPSLPSTRMINGHNNEVNDNNDGEGIRTIFRTRRIQGLVSM